MHTYNFTSDAFFSSNRREPNKFNYLYSEYGTKNKKSVQNVLFNEN